MANGDGFRTDLGTDASLRTFSCRQRHDVSGPQEFVAHAITSVTNEVFAIVYAARPEGRP